MLKDNNKVTYENKVLVKGTTVEYIQKDDGRFDTFFINEEFDDLMDD